MSKTIYRTLNILREISDVIILIYMWYFLGLTANVFLFQYSIIGGITCFIIFILANLMTYIEQNRYLKEHYRVEVKNRIINVAVITCKYSGIKTTTNGNILKQ